MSERMPAAGSRAEAKQRTRQALLDAATQLFAEQGLDGPSLDAICERAGKTRGAFYVHFEDRDQLLVAVMDQVGSAFLQSVLGPAGPAGPGGPGGPGAGDPAALVQTFQRFLMAVGKGEYPLMREGGVRPHQLLDACARSPAIRRRYVGLVEDSIARLDGAVQLGQLAGLLRDDVAPGQVATMLLAAVIGAQTMAELRIQLDLGQAAAAFLTLLSPPMPSLAPAVAPAPVKAPSAGRRSRTRSTSPGPRRGL